MGRTVKHAIVVEALDGERILLPPYRYEQDAKLACQRLVDLDSVHRAVPAKAEID